MSNLHYKVVGQGIPLVCLHGLGGDMQQVIHLFEPFHKLEKIYIDCPGHGKSMKFEVNELSFDFISDTIISFLDELHIESFLVAGISMEAGIAMNMMERHPDRLLGAILIRPAWLDCDEPDNLKILKKAALYMQRGKSYQSFAKTKEIQTLETSLPNAVRSISKQFERIQGAISTSQLLKTMIADKPINKLSSLSSFFKPCLIFCSDNDPTHPKGYGRLIHSVLPNASLEQVHSKYIDAEIHITEIQAATKSFIAAQFPNH